MMELARLKPIRTWCKAHNFSAGDRVVIVEDISNREPAFYSDLYVGGLVGKLATVTSTNIEENIVYVRPDHRQVNYRFWAHELHPLYRSKFS